MATLAHWLNGHRMVNDHPSALTVHNPATGQILHHVPIADSQIVNQAVAHAKAAFPEWSTTPAIKRARLMFKYQELLHKNLDTLAKIVSEEHGKLIADARGSVLRGLEVVELACGAPQLLKGWFSENVATDIDCSTMRQALGVCVGITPFNFPAMIPLWMFPLALVCGNTFVLKPSEKNPSCALKLAELLHEAGLPAGVLNVVQGDKSTVDALITHPDVAAISFVGSSHVAQHIQQTGIRHGKRVQAFGGAKNHAVVMPDADLSQTAEAIVGAAFGSAGERCMALSIAVAVGEATADALVKHLIDRCQTVVLGASDEAHAQMGPLISLEHLAKVEHYVQIGCEEGARLLIDGRGQKPKAGTHQQGYYLGACLFDHVKPHMRIYQEEIFGPVLGVVRVNHFEEALHLVNTHPYGNGTAIFTKDGDTARTYASQVQVGMVGINVPIPVPAPFHAFGGWKQSIYADIPMHGSESIQFYTKLKTTTWRWPDQTVRHGFDMTSHS